MATFQVKIKLGSKGMNHRADIGRALDSIQLDRRTSGLIRDFNGNIVGEWKISPEWRSGRFDPMG